MISSTSRADRYAVCGAGFTRLGMGEERGRELPSGPQTGKLNALICTATPCSGVQMCRPANVPPLLSGSTSPSTSTVSLGSSRLPLLAYASRTPMPPSTSIFESPSVAPVRADSAYSSSRCSRR